MDIGLADVIGYSAAFFGTTVMIPQVLKTWRSKKADDISFVMLFFYFMNCLLWLCYAVLIDSQPLLITNAIALLISTFQIFLKIKY
jgi:MtN3 and saliva related transmembrane protein